MVGVPITIEGGDQLIAALKKLGAEGEREVARVVTATAIEVRGEIVKKYQKGPKTGRIYTRGNVVHQASAPGQAPATDTGRLASATEYVSTGRFSAEVRNSVAYGPMLEFGTNRLNFTGGVGGPRPAWRPAVEEAAPKYLKRLEDALKKVMK
jgi:hypothetical protein